MVIGRTAIVLAVVAEALLIGVMAEWIAAAYSASEAHAVAIPSLIICALVGYALSIQRSEPPLDRHEELSLSERLRREAETKEQALEDATDESKWAMVLRAAIFYVVVYGLLRIQFAGDIAVWNLSWVVDVVKHFDIAAEHGAPALIAGICLLAIWARSSLRASNEIELESVTKSLSIPFTIVTIIIVLGAATSRSGEVARAGAAFYACAVIAMACSQLAMSGVTFGQIRAGGSTATVLLLTLAATAVTLVVLGLVFAVFGEPLGRVLAKVMEITLTIILTPIAWVLEWFFGLLFGDKNPFQDIANGLQQQPQRAQEPNAGNRSGFEQFATYAFRILALAVFAVVIWFFAVMFARLRRRRIAHQALEAKGVSGSLNEDFRSFLKSLVPGAGWRRTKRAGTESPTVALYREVVDHAESQGAHRAEGQTAAEFAPVLNSTFESSIPGEVTRAFEAARYGDREADQAEIDEWRGKLLKPR